MTEQQPAVIPLLATATPGSRLEQLLAQYESAKAEAAEAADKFDAVTKAIKGELTRMHPGQPVVRLTGAPGMPQLIMRWKQSWRLDSKRLKAEQPELYVRYAVRGGTWELRAES